MLWEIDYLGLQWLRCLLNKRYFSMNHFETFNLKPVFDIDQKSLLARYFELQKKYHPDQNNKSKNASNINEAYEILKDDISRAEYLLDLNKIALPNLDIDLLSIFLEENEEIENSSDKENLKMILDQKNTRLKEIISEMHIIIDNNFSKFAILCTEAKYVKRIISNIKQKIKTL